MEFRTAGGTWGKASGRCRGNSCSSTGYSTPRKIRKKKKRNSSGWYYDRGYGKTMRRVRY